MVGYINVKDSVRFTRFPLVFADFLRAVYYSWNLYAPTITPVITSANDSKHMDTSLHYKDLAWDLRTNNLEAGQIEEIARMMRVQLGSDWDIVVEATHLHAEFDKEI